MWPINIFINSYDTAIAKYVQRHQLTRLRARTAELRQQPAMQPVEEDSPRPQLALAQ